MYYCAHKTATLTPIQHTVPCYLGQNPDYAPAYVLLGA